LYGLEEVLDGLICEHIQFYDIGKIPEGGIHWRLISIKDGMATAAWLAPDNKLKVGDMRGEFEKLDPKDPRIEICKKDSMWRLINSQSIKKR
jgi:hypothetical protein